MHYMTGGRTDTMDMNMDITITRSACMRRAAGPAPVPRSEVFFLIVEGG